MNVIIGIIATIILIPLFAIGLMILMYALVGIVYYLNERKD